MPKRVLKNEIRPADPEKFYTVTIKNTTDSNIETLENLSSLLIFTLDSEGRIEVGALGKASGSALLLRKLPALAFDIIDESPALMRLLQEQGIEPSKRGVGDHFVDNGLDELTKRNLKETIERTLTLLKDL